MAATAGSRRNKNRRVKLGRPEFTLLPEKKDGSEKDNPLTVENLRRLSTIQCTYPEMAAFFGISKRTFQRMVQGHPEYEEIIEEERKKGLISVRHALFGMVMNPKHPKHAAAAIYLSKNYLGMSDSIQHQVAGLDGGPVEVAMRKLTPQEREARIQELLARRAANATDDTGRH